MATDTSDQTIHHLNITQEVEIAAPIEITFQAVLEELGPGGQMPDGNPFPLVLEPWPGGRWYRDLGNNSGHFWGQVQVIKPPTLLEICGPAFMSYPVVQHIQYRLTAQGASTFLRITHRAFGLIPADHRDNVQSGWEQGLKRVGEIAATMLAERAGG